MRREGTRPGKSLSSAAVRKITRAPFRAVRVISLHKAVRCLIVHPVLRVEEHITVEARGGTCREHLGERALLEAHAIGAGPHRLEILPLQIGWERGIARHRVTAAEGLPGEVIRLDVEAAAEVLEPLAKHGSDALGKITRKATVLGGRDAEAIKGGRLSDEPTQQRLVEDRRDVALVENALLRHSVGLEQGFGVAAVKP